MKQEFVRLLKGLALLFHCGLLIHDFCSAIVFFLPGVLSTYCYFGSVVLADTQQPSNQISTLVFSLGHLIKRDP